MKLIFLLLSCFEGLILSAQTDQFNPKASFGLSTGDVWFKGNNFVTKTYDAKLPFSLDLNINVVSKLGLGVDFSQWNSRIKTTEYVGNSAKGKFTNWNYYVHYYYQWNEKWLLNPKIGLGTFRINNTLDNTPNTDKSERHYVSKGNSFFISPEINYFITRNLSIYSGVKYQYVHMHVNGSDANNTSYRSTNLWALNIGVRLWKR